MKSGFLIPVALFLWKKHHCLDKVLKSLVNCQGFKKTKVFIFVDNAEINSKDFKSNITLKKKLSKYLHYKNITVIYRKKKLGLKKNILNGITNLLKVYKEVIVLEDDLVVSKDFLKYMNESLNFYKNNKLILSISAFNHKTLPTYNSKYYEFENFFSLRASSWGWGTWRDRWSIYKKKISVSEIKNQKKNITNYLGHDVYFALLNINKKKRDLWAANWCFAGLKNEMYTSYPMKSRISNIGFDGTGQGGYSNRYKNNFNFKKKEKKYNFSHYPHISNNCINQTKFISYYNENILLQYFKYYMPLRLKKFIKNLVK